MSAQPALAVPRNAATPRRSLRRRLMSAFVVVVCLSIALGGLALDRLARVSATTAHIGGQTLPSVQALGRIGLATGRFRMAALQALDAADANQESLQNVMGAALEDIEDAQKLYEPLIGSGDERDTYSGFMSAWSEYMLAHATSNQMAMEGQKDQARALLAGDAQTQFDVANARLASIESASDRVTRIIQTIDAIAFQTNILALNAAVEAARAGGAGAGFAVVADEVRSLAQRSAQAARDSAGLIEESHASARQGTRTAHLVTEAVQAFTAQVARVHELVGTIKTASDRQTQGVDRVERAVADVTSATRQTVAAAEQSAAAGERLNEQAAVASDQAAALSALVRGQRAARSPAGTSPAGAAIRLRPAA